MVDNKCFRFSKQSMAVITNCLLKSLSEERDITELFCLLNLEIIDDEIFVTNPDVIKFENKSKDI